MSDLSVKLYESVRKLHTPREINAWHASSIAKCPRALYFERKQVASLQEVAGGKLLRWRAGHAIEAAIRPHLEDIHPNLLTNLRFSNDNLQLTGEFDAYDPDTKQLFSVKSVHDYAMITRNGQVGLKERVGTDEKGKAVFELKKGPYPHHEWQEHAYVLLMSHPSTLVVGDQIPLRWAEDGQAILNKSWPVKQITYIYITLGGLVVTYTTDVKPEILSRVEKKVAYLNQCWLTGELPICTCKEGAEFYPEQNQYCIYRTASGCCSPALLRTKEADNV